MMFVIFLQAREPLSCISLFTGVAGLEIGLGGNLWLVCVRCEIEVNPQQARVEISFVAYSLL